MLGQRYRLNTPDVVAETVDGEALIVNLRTGIYFSATGATEAAWSAIIAGHLLDEGIDAVTAASGAEREAVAAWAAILLAQCLEQDLLAPATESPAGSTLWVTEPLAFEPALLHMFTDMQELLILDPVHDVDEAAGWPAART